MFRLFFSIFLTLGCSVQAGTSTYIPTDNYLYTPYHRDALFIIDWATESVAATFDPSGNNLKELIGSASIYLLAALYTESCPIIAANSLWRNILDRVQLWDDALALNSTQFQKKYLTIPEYKSTLLADPTFLQRLQHSIKKSKDIYDQLNQAIAKQLKQPGNTIANIAYTVSNIPIFRDTTMGGTLTTPADQQVWEVAASFLVCKIVIDQVRSSYNQAKWIMRQLSPTVYLFIPRSYLEGVTQTVQKLLATHSITRTFEIVFKNSIPDRFTGRFLTVEEIILNLKFDSFRPLTTPFIASAHPITKERDTELSEGLVQLIPRLFITPQDFKPFVQSENFWIPNYCTWNIIAFGHGSPGQLGEAFNFYVAGLRAGSFQTFLNTLNTLNTRFLYYTSCYAAGHRLENMYAKPESGKIKYKFTIIVGALSHAITYTISATFMPPYIDKFGLVPENINRVTNTIQPTFAQNLRAFFSELHRGGLKITERDGTVHYVRPLPYSDIVALINPYYTKNPSMLSYLANVPQIRLPGSQWFNIIDLNTLIVRLTPTLIAVREAENRPITIHNKSLILLDTAYIWESPQEQLEKLRKARQAAALHSEIMVPLVVEGIMPAVVSSAGADVQVYISELRPSQTKIMPYIELIDTIRKFLGVSGTVYGRTYYIQKLTVRNDMTIAQATAIESKRGSIVTLTNVLILVNAPDPRNRKDANRYTGIIFTLPNGTRYQALFTTDAELDQLKKGTLPNLTETTLVTPSYPYELRTTSPLVPVAQQQKLISEYTKLSNDPKKLALWKSTLSPEEQAFINRYEARYKAAQQTSEQRQRELLQEALVTLNVRLTSLSTFLKK